MMVGGGGILLASIAIVAVSKLGTLRGPALTKPAYDSVAVLPMKNLGLDASQSQHLAEGMGQSLSAKLSQLSRLRVTPWATSRRFAERGRTIQEIGQSLNVDAVVASTFRKKDSRIEIVVSLMDAKTGSRAWSKSLEEPLSDLFTVQRRVAVELATRLWGKLTQDEERDLGSQPSASVEAYEDYLEGAHHAGKGQAEDDVALALFDKAIQLDPKLDEAYVGIGTVHLDHALGDSSDIRKSLEAAEGAFRNALQLAATNLSARRGMIKIFWLRGQPEECLKTGREIPKGRDMTEVLTARAEAYLYGGLCDQAAPLLKRAIELDPQNQDAHFSLVHALAWSGQFRQAVEAGEAYLRGFGDDPRIRLTIGQSFRGIGELARARDQYVTIAQQTPDDPANQLFADEGRLDKALGDPDRARETWEAGTAVLKRHLKAHRKIAETRFHLAELYALLGHGDLFEQELARARKERGALPDDPNEAIAGYVALDEKDRALEGLHRRLAAGRLGQFWFNVERLSTSGLENMPGYNQLIKEYNARQEGLRQVY
jgi:TolB-like protein/thioredoxin-like negative regulator of GroEL